MMPGAESVRVPSRSKRIYLYIACSFECIMIV
jgi:hypothetical protein